MSGPLPEDVMCAKFWRTVAATAALHDAEGALEFVKELAPLEGKLSISIVPNGRSIEEQSSAPASNFRGRPMPAKFAGRCAVCAGTIKIGADILYSAELRRAAHIQCGDPT